MTGPSSLVLDTNAVIALLAGNDGLRDLSEQTERLAISIVTYVEFLASPRLTSLDASLFEQLMDHVDVIDLTLANTDMVGQIIKIRRRKAMKLPDSIVVATAIDRQATLVTADIAIHRTRLVPCLAY